MSDNSWYEKGEFPPVLTRCVYDPKDDVDDSNSMVAGKEVCFLAWFHCADGDECVAFEHKAFGLKCYTASPSDFRPIKTDRELAIEAALSATRNTPYYCGAVRYLASVLFDAGLLRSKNES